ncbi:MAG: GtrA family protein [Promethearchaeota archaeon]
MVKVLSKTTFKQAFKFALVGCLGTFVNLGVLYFFTEYCQVFYIISEVFAFVVAGLHNYLFDKLWVFKEKVRDQVGIKYARFIIISLISLIINLFVLYILVEYFDIWYIFAEIVAIIFGFLINFSGNKFWTFRIKKLKPET